VISAFKADTHDSGAHYGRQRRKCSRSAAQYRI
jgi:hypothetical protein